MKHTSPLAGLVLAAFCLAAQADYVIDKSQANRVVNGMSMQEVRDLLGKPKQDRTFATGLTTWTYDLRPTDDNIFFDVEFDAAKNVKRTERRMEGGY